MPARSQLCAHGTGGAVFLGCADCAGYGRTAMNQNRHRSFARLAGAVGAVPPQWSRQSTIREKICCKAPGPCLYACQTCAGPPVCCVIPLRMPCHGHMNGHACGHVWGHVHKHAHGHQYKYAGGDVHGPVYGCACRFVYQRVRRHASRHEMASLRSPWAAQERLPAAWPDILPLIRASKH